MLVHLYAHELRNLLANAILFVERGKTKIKDLDGVLLQDVNGSLCATSTDRYRLVDILAETYEMDEGFRLFISSEQTKEILEFIKTEKGSLIRIEREGTDGAAGKITVSTTWSEGRSITLEQVEDRFPAARNLFAKKPAVFLGDRVIFQASVEHLASLARVKDHRPDASKNETMLVIPPQENGKPVKFIRGDWFRALLMPGRPNSGQHPLVEHHQRRFG